MEQNEATSSADASAAAPLSLTGQCVCGTHAGLGYRALLFAGRMLLEGGNSVSVLNVSSKSSSQPDV